MTLFAWVLEFLVAPFVFVSGLPAYKPNTLLSGPSFDCFETFFDKFLMTRHYWSYLSATGKARVVAHK